MEKNHAIDLKNISKEYGENRVLDNINLYIRKNEFLTLLGPSGCGKTTTLRIIGGFEQPTEKPVEIEEFEVGPFVDDDLDIPAFLRRNRKR